jgi:hypothetical protein
MRAVKAKKIRKEVYGDTSLRIQRKYIGGKIGWPAKGYVSATIRNAPSSLRAIYQQAKREA